MVSNNDFAAGLDHTCKPVDQPNGDGYVVDREAGDRAVKACAVQAGGGRVSDVEGDVAHAGFACFAASGLDHCGGYVDTMYARHRARQPAADDTRAAGCLQPPLRKRRLRVVEDRVEDLVGVGDGTEVERRGLPSEGLID